MSNESIQVFINKRINEAIKKYESSINAELKILKKENEEMKKELKYIRFQISQVSRLIDENEDFREDRAMALWEEKPIF